MNALDRAIATVSPSLGLRRMQARHALSVMQRTASMHYDAATTGRRGSSWHAVNNDADGAAGFGRRQRMAAVARDMVRNSPYARRAQDVISNNVVGDGIIPKIVDAPKALADEGLTLIERHLDTTDIDADGRNNLYGLQRLAVNTVTDAGEVLMVRCDLPLGSGKFLPFQIKLLEPDHLDATRDGVFSDGRSVVEGIQYNAAGEREGYWLYLVHPGTSGYRGMRLGQQSEFFPASHVAHIYRQDRPGQMRGVSWFAPVALSLQDLSDYQDAQIMRQKIASCFAGFRRLGSDAGKTSTELDGTLGPGLIQDIGFEEEMIFSDPPSVGDFDQFITSVLRSMAAGLGITYEALSGDLSRVNFSSARMGRMEMDRNVSSWQWTMVIPQMLQPLGVWMQQAWMVQRPAKALAISRLRLDWVPPHRILVDPAREIPALIDSIRGGLTSRQAVVRSLGHDPERLLQEQVADKASADEYGLIFDSDAAHVSGSGVTQARPPGSEIPKLEEDGDE